MSGKDSVILDAEKGEVMVRFGEEYKRMILMVSEAFVRMMETLNAFGTAGLTMFYMMGQEKGRYDILKEIEMLRQQGVSFTKHQVLENIVHQLRVTGWGAFRIQKYDEEHVSLTILVENNPLVATLSNNKKSDRPICHYLRGYLVGVVSLVLETKVSCVETKCVGIGDKYCEFKITVADRI